MTDEKEDLDYDSGPYCRHWSDPSECRQLCGRCRHTCTSHWEGCDVDGCACTEFDDEIVPIEPDRCPHGFSSAKVRLGSCRACIEDATIAKVVAFVRDIPRTRGVGFDARVIADWIAAGEWKHGGPT